MLEGNQERTEQGDDDKFITSSSCSGNETAVTSALHLSWTGHVAFDFVEKGSFSKALYHFLFPIFSYINLY